mgnify:FL=1
MIIKDDDETCLSCMYFDKSKDMLVGKGTGSCRLAPPTGAALLIGQGQVAPIGVWPQVSEGDWCGQYEWDGGDE